ncbi:M16 family metallopeptidase [Ideonella livida]|uniref:Insulinase family protein n=1 Tax=Ideonella livida TaxID=2707176 RepID=A0A7C9TN51_9BURK|nr:pitrilysin family protein [Ideonella livida]NDY93503.1 insulinase family protein [Ideonella livida]
MNRPVPCAARRHAHHDRRQWLARALAAAAGLGLPPLSRAEPGVDEPPLPGTPRLLRLPEPRQAWLDNGLQVVVAPLPGLPLVTLSLMQRPGGLADPLRLAGRTAQMAQLRTRGARWQGRALDATGLARVAEGLGGSLAAGAGLETTHTSLTITRPQLDTALQLLGAVVRQPTLAAAEWSRQRDSEADGLRFALSDPGTLAGWVGSRAFWGDSVLGSAFTAASLSRLRLDDLRQAHAAQDRPDGSCLLLTGDIQLEEALALAHRHLGGWRRPTSPAPVSPAPGPARPQAPATVLVDLPGAGQCAVVVSAPAVGAESPERRVAQLASAVLGTGYRSRLNEAIRIRRGLSYDARTALELQAPGGRLSAVSQTAPANAAEVVRLSRQVLTSLADQPPSAEELAARQATLLGGLSRQVETTAGLAGRLADLVARQRPLDELARIGPELLAVTPEQVQALAARDWTPARLRTVVVGDLQAAGDSLRQLDPDALVLSVRQLDLDLPGLRR